MKIRSDYVTNSSSSSFINFSTKKRRSILECRSKSIWSKKELYETKPRNKLKLTDMVNRIIDTKNQMMNIISWMSTFPKIEVDN